MDIPCVCGLELGILLFTAFQPHTQTPIRLSWFECVVYKLLLLRGCICVCAMLAGFYIICMYVMYTTHDSGSCQEKQHGNRWWNWEFEKSCDLCDHSLQWRSNAIASRQLGMPTGRSDDFAYTFCLTYLTMVQCETISISCGWAPEKQTTARPIH